MNADTRITHYEGARLWIHRFAESISRRCFEIVALKGSLPSDGIILELCNNGGSLPPTGLGGTVRRDSKRKATVSLWRNRCTQ